VKTIVNAYARRAKRTAVMAGLQKKMGRLHFQSRQLKSHPRGIHSVGGEGLDPQILREQHL
jgi:hypothetical protein